MNALPTDPLRALAALVVKDGVGLGGLPAAQRALALALVWAGLPAADGLTERQVNERLKAQLAGAAAFLDTDHAELRRWLVDAGWLARDGYGREYRRVALQALQAGHQDVAEPLAGIDVTAWVAELRHAHRVRRDVRRIRWQDGKGAPS